MIQQQPNNQKKSQEDVLNDLNECIQLNQCDEFVKHFGIIFIIQ